MLFYKKYIEMKTLFIELLLQGDQAPIVHIGPILIFLLLL
jgi:hypothetical protein